MGFSLLFGAWAKSNVKTNLQLLLGFPAVINVWQLSGKCVLTCVEIKQRIKLYPPSQSANPCVWGSKKAKRMEWKMGCVCEFELFTQLAMRIAYAKNANALET